MPSDYIEVINWDQQQQQDQNNDEEEDASSATRRTTLLYQLEKKYFQEQQLLDSSIALFGTSPCQAAFEGELELVVLDALKISQIGDLCRLQKLASNIRELDLYYNQISSWSVVQDLLASLPYLKTLNLSHNPLEPTVSFDQNLVAPKLKTLILNGITPLPFTEIEKFIPTLPSLNELHLSHRPFSNDITLEEEGSPLSTVTILYITECQLSQWSDVLRIIRRFPNLTSLFLADNPIEEVTTTNLLLNTGKMLASLVTLSLSNTQLCTWKAIENLAEIAQLRELRCANIPLLEKFSEEERRHLVVGRLPNIQLLNGSYISDFQREESERFFIRYYQCAAAADKPQIYEKLVLKHGELEQLVKVDLTPKEFARVQIHCEETGYSSWARIKLRTSVQSLMRYIEQKTNIPLKKMRLFYYDANVYGLGPTELRFPKQILQTLHIEDGDKFLILSKAV